MAIDFTLTPEQKKMQADVRAFAENVLAPVVREADAEPATAVSKHRIEFMKLFYAPRNLFRPHAQLVG